MREVLFFIVLLAVMVGGTIYAISPHDTYGPPFNVTVYSKSALIRDVAHCRADDGTEYDVECDPFEFPGIQLNQSLSIREVRRFWGFTSDFPVSHWEVAPPAPKHK